MSPDFPQQLSLGVSLNDDATFDNFFAPQGSTNEQVVTALKQQLADTQQSFIYLWGGSGCGLTHLLQAACHGAQQQGLGFQYLPLRDLIGYAPAELFAGLDELDLIAIDGLDLLAGRPDWELALFSLYNQLRDAGKRLLVSATQGPQNLALSLPDLKSRLQWGITFRVAELDDEDKKAALQFRAKARGLELSDEVSNYILQRLPRDMNELFWQLNRLDQASLAEQRKITIPFVKKIIDL